MTLKADAATLLERLRNAHRARTDTTATNTARQAAAVVAQDLVDEASPELLRVALTAAVQPDGGQPPIPVVLGPQDAAAVTVTVDEVMALVGIYGDACSTWAPGRRVTDEQIMAAFAEVRGAVEVLAAAAVLNDAARTAMGG